MAVEHGMTRQFVDWADLSTSIATFKNGEWTDRSLARTNPDRQSVLRNATGMEFDPVNPSVIVRGSRTDGVSMINLDDPQQIVHLSVADNPDNGKPGFYTVFSPHPTQDRHLPEYRLLDLMLKVRCGLPVQAHPYLCIIGKQRIERL